VIKLAGQLVPLKVDAEKEGAELAKKYKVQGYPTILFIDSAGEVWGTIGGYLPPAPFAEAMTGVIETHKSYPAAVEALKKNPNDGKANASMARVYASRGKLVEATAAVTKMEAGKYKGKDLAAIYNAVGDGYQNAQKFDDAIKYFKKGESASQNAKDKSYSLVSLMFCYLGKDDQENATKTAKQLIALKDATPEYVEYAKQVVGGG
jgi:tetratricopeptide (TPR) repeat protein